ncbi:MAG: GTPase Era, partial [Pseudomonadota bacterium]
MAEPAHHSGFVGLIGAPNVGKSTLLNLVLGEKIAITSDKPQTTRHRILGVWTAPGAQILFLDTPGVHKAQNLLGRELVAQALEVITDVDVILFLVEPGRREQDETLVMESLKDTDKPIILVINKIDRFRKPDLLPLIEAYARKLNPAAVVPISALTGENVPALLQELVDHLPEGPQYYPPDTLTDLPERFIAAEMIREQIFRLTGQEIPYSAAVTVEEFKEESSGLIRIGAVIHVERESQKKIVIGRGGVKLKDIG